MAFEVNNHTPGPPYKTFIRGTKQRKLFTDPEQLSQIIPSEVYKPDWNNNIKLGRSFFTFVCYPMIQMNKAWFPVE